jgi:hypothetical protein
MRHFSFDNIPNSVDYSSPLMSLHFLPTLLSSNISLLSHFLVSCLLSPIRARISQCGICGGQSGWHWEGSSPSSPVFSCQYRSTVAIHTRISSGGWNIGPLVATVHRRSLTPSTLIIIYPILLLLSLSLSFLHPGSLSFPFFFSPFIISFFLATYRDSMPGKTENFIFYALSGSHLFWEQRGRNVKSTIHLHSVEV